MKKFRSNYSKLYTSCGNLRQGVYLYKGDVVRPKDVERDGMLCLDLGKKHGIKELPGILSLSLTRPEVTNNSPKWKPVIKEAVNYSFDKWYQIERVA